MVISVPPASVSGSQSRIPILLCINAGYAQHAGVLLVSLIENNRHLSFNVAVVSTEPLGDGETRLRRTLDGYTNCTLRVVVLNESSGFTLPVMAEHYTIDTYSRLWIAEVFPPEVTKALYLDSDMVVVGPIDELWNTALGDHVLAAVTIPGSNRCPIFAIPERYEYFQSGVMLIDLAKWRAERVFDRLLDWIAANSHKIIDADQDVLNACLYDRRLNLPYVWNVIAPFYFDYHPLGMSEEDRRDVTRRARIIHFNGPMKPWSYMSRHPRRADYWKYLKLSDWRDFQPADKSVLNWTKKYFGPLVPASVRAQLKRFA